MIANLLFYEKNDGTQRIEQLELFAQQNVGFRLVSVNQCDLGLIPLRAGGFVATACVSTDKHLTSTRARR